MSKFDLDPSDSPDENIKRFFDHLKAHDPEMADILLSDWQNVCVPQIMGNFVAHYATSVGASISPHVYLSVLAAIDGAVNLFHLLLFMQWRAENRLLAQPLSKVKGLLVLKERFSFAPSGRETRWGCDPGWHCVCPPSLRWSYNLLNT